MEITKSEITVIGDGKNVDPDLGGIEPLPILKVNTDEGITGMSEMFRVPPGVARSALVGKDSFFGSMFLGMDMTHPEAIWNRLYSNMLHSNRRGWAMRCLGALDVALWDIYGKSLNQPVFQLLGGNERNPFQTGPSKTTTAKFITPYATIVSDSWEPKIVLKQQVERSEKLASEGFKAFKIEPMHSSQETIIELMRLTRNALGPKLKIAIDVGYGFNNYNSALWVAERIKEYDVFFFETPFPVDFVQAYTNLSKKTNIPLAMGEHASSRFEFFSLMDQGGVSICQPYASNCGGLTECKRLVEHIHIRGNLLIPGNWSTQILGMANNHLATYSPVSPFVEYAPSQIYKSPLRNEIQKLSSPVKNGQITIPQKPGIGIELPEDLVKQFELNL